jgi:hypothetical protein
MLASHRGGPGSSSGQVMWYLWWTKRYRGMFSPSASVPRTVIPPIAPHSSSSSRTIGQIVADVPSGLNLTPPKGTKTKQKQKNKGGARKKQHFVRNESPEEYNLMGYIGMYCGDSSTFRRNIFSVFRIEEKAKKKKNLQKPGLMLNFVTR